MTALRLPPFSRSVPALVERTDQFSPFGVLADLEGKGAIALQLRDLRGQLLSDLSESLLSPARPRLDLLGDLLDHVVIDKAFDRWALLGLQPVDDLRERFGYRESR